ncbi:MAG: hypothetical protein ABIR55_02740 [Burkholderiaceae bacterium]
MAIRNFCTLFDSSYAFKGVAMLRSLRAHCPDAAVHVLCMDAITVQVIASLGLPGVTCIALGELEDDALLAAKRNRNVAEYCWTLTPCLLWYLLQRYPDIENLTYLDADLYFYASVEPLFAEIGDASIAIIEHRFTPRLRHLEVNGKFCVEWVGFGRDAQALECLQRWRSQCLEWCYARLEEGRMGDQKYLDEWPQRYPSLHVLQHRGAGLAPWNFDNHRFARLASGDLSVNGVPLVFYHFHQFQILEGGKFDRLSASYIADQREPEEVYRVYEQAMRKAIHDVRQKFPGFSFGIKSALQVSSRRWVQRFVPRRLKEALRRAMTRFSGAL